MGWIASFGTALLTAILGMFGAGFVADFAVDWYNVSSFEGGAGFFVIGMALVGVIGGFIVGLVVSRVVARRPQPRFSKALGISVGATAVLLAAIGVASWLLADIPPQIDGEELFLLTEIRWPANGAPAPRELSDPYFRLGALSGSVARKIENGPVFVDDARQEEGRWILPGALPIFTRRGERLLEFGAGEKSIAGFIVPLPRYPGEAQRQWSGWLPAPRSGELPADQFTYRFRVIRRSEPMRTERIGPFEVDTIGRYFYSSGSDRLAVHATFRTRYRGQPVPDVATAENVAVVGGSRPALFVTISEPNTQHPCALLIDDDGTLRVQHVAGCGTPFAPRLLTSDQMRFVAARERRRLPGWVDRGSFAEPGLFQLDAAIVDTRTLTTAEFLFPSESGPNTAIQPLGLSPDERSFVWLARGSDEAPRLGVTDWRASRSYMLPIDRLRMRFNTESALDPRWVLHHFEWRRRADDVDELVERANFVPLPYHGDLLVGKAGGYQSYTLRPGAEPLRDAVVDLLVRNLKSEVVPEESGGYRRRVRVSGKEVSVAVLGSPSYVYLTMDEGDPQIMSAIAATVDAELATGRYDRLFVASREQP
jgi:hypothetical protein